MAVPQYRPGVLTRLVGILLLVMVFQGAVQEAKTQTEGRVGNPTFQEGTQPTFATGDIIVNLPP